MQAAQLPTKFPIPFAAAAGTQYSRTIPTPSQITVQDGAASLTDGFPPKTFIPLTSGGTSPFGQDFNGLLNQITAWCRWQGAGGLSTYDSAFCTTIAGYPQGAVLASTTPGQVWLNLVDGNLTNPDGAQAQNWTSLATAAGIQSGQFTFGNDSGTANTLVVTPLFPVAAYVRGMVVRTQPLTDCTGAATVNVFGLGVRAIVKSGRVALTGGEWKAGDMIDLEYDGTSFQLHAVSGAGLSGVLPHVVCYVADTGTADALTGAGSPAITSYALGQPFLVMKAGAANATTAPTLNVSGLGAKTITRSDGTPLAVGDLPANAAFLCFFDGTNIRRVGLTASDVQAALSGGTSGLEKGWRIAQYAVASSAGLTITALDHQRIEVDVTNGPATVNLPSAPTANTQFEVYRKGKSSNALTVSVAGGGSTLAFNDGTTDTALVIDSSSALNVVGIYADGSVYRFNPGIIV